MFLENFEANYQIFIVYAVIKSVTVATHGFDIFLEPLMQELQRLSHDDSSIEIIQRNYTIPLQVALMAYVGDTPAANQAGGFKEGVGGALRKCRHCECDEESMQTYFTEEDFLIRTLNRHLQQCSTIENAPTESLAEHFSTTYGINRRSALCDAPYFDVCQQIPPDIMHILLEGVVPYTTKLVLYYFIYKTNQH